MGEKCVYSVQPDGGNSMLSSCTHPEFTLDRGRHCTASKQSGTLEYPEHSTGINVEINLQKYIDWLIERQQVVKYLDYQLIVSVIFFKQKCETSAGVFEFWTLS